MQAMLLNVLIASSILFCTHACQDKPNPATGYSDCPMRRNLCNDPTYFTLMSDQCPRTCNRCKGPQPTPSCVDKVNPATGVSDCGFRRNWCNAPGYHALMTDQCPRTCGRC